MNRIFVFGLLVLCLTAGCVSKSTADARARAAFQAGRQQGEQAMAPKGPMVVVNGNVQAHEIPWVDGMTLIQVLLQAHYLGEGDPTHITITRAGEVIPVDPKQVLQGQDQPLQQGDVIDLQ